MHPCSELPESLLVFDSKTQSNSWTLPRDEQCLKYITQNYSPKQTQAGTGSYGTVLRLVHKRGIPSEVAVKILPFETKPNKFYSSELIIHDTQRELLISCKLNTTKQWTNVFTQTFGWLICTNIPEDWVRYVKTKGIMYANAKKTSFMFMFMEHAAHKFRSRANVFTTNDYVTLFFLIVHGLYIARREFGFIHGDLHAGNVMFAETTANNPVVKIAIQNVSFNIDLPSGTYPKIIDFGLSKMNGVNGGRDKPDVANLVTIFQQRAEKMEDIEAETLFTNLIDNCSEEQRHVLYCSDGSDYESLENFLLTDPLFAFLRTNKRAKIDKQVLTCFSCNAEATVMWDNGNEDMKFCTPFCSNKIIALGNIIPKK